MYIFLNPWKYHWKCRKTNFMNYLHPPSTRIVKTEYDTQFFGAVVMPWIYLYVYVGRSTVLIFLFRQFLDFWKALTELQALRILWNTKQIIGIFFFFFFLFLSFSFFNMNNTCLRTTYFLML